MPRALVQRLDHAFAARWLAAGGAWGLTLAAGFLAFNASSCGLPRPEDVAATAGICLAAGLVTIGPFAAFAGQHR